MLSEKYGARWPALIGNPALTRGKELLRREGSSKKKKKEKKEGKKKRRVQKVGQISPKSSPNLTVLWSLQVRRSC